jgi:hypothetical protein
MNARTQKALVEFSRQVQQLAAAVVLHVGVQTVSEVSQACLNLELAVAQDETIVEVS